ncbi:pentraxin-4 [Patagioenas fasciata monilis]|uniref:Pentraxin-4 n=1 Tax=Patagioenas fasciata monilis TaxID=372326 RepID=A0A1V4KTI0_PATFA|nr:pentraxin-4 [Patagioenas fasciata monilis]
MQGGLIQVPRPAARPSPLLLRLQRLEEQLHRLQEVILSHLQSIAGNYNISYNIDGRFQALAEQAEAAAAAQAALGAELARLTSAGRRLHRRLKRLERTEQPPVPQQPAEAPHLGALLSYVIEDGSSKLAMRGHSGDLPGSARFIIGDGQGQYRLYVDRRLLAAGSGFQQGYEIPAGGLLVLGWEKDHPGKGSSTAEAFVGHLAGLALWSRALLPGEGEVRRVAGPFLRHCL